MTTAEHDVIRHTLSATAAHAALIEAGIIKPDERIRRIVIDIQTHKPVMVHIERYGDDRLLDALVPHLAGIPETKAGTHDDGVDIDYDAVTAKDVQ